MVVEGSKSNIDLFRRWTITAEMINNAVEAPLQIDRALTAAITHKRPAYIEVLEDVWRSDTRVSYP